MEDHRVEIERAADELSLARPGYPRSVGYPDIEPYGYGYGYGDAKGPINVRAVLRTILKRKWLIAVIVLIVACVATVEVYRTKSLYRATASIEIRSDNTTVVKTADVLVYTDDSEAINTYMFMLKSRPLLKEVVVNLRLDENPKFLEVNGRKSVWDAVKTVGDKLRPGNGERLQAGEPAANGSTPGSSESESDNEKIGALARVIANNLNVEQLPDARVLAVSFTHTDPFIAAEVANAVAHGFIDHSFKSRTEKYDKASKWLDRTTRELKAKVEKAEETLNNYMRETNLSFSSTNHQQNIATEKFLRLNEQVQRAHTERVLKQSIYEEVKAGRIDELPESFADGQIIDLQKKLRELLVTAAQLDVKYGRNNPKVIEVQQQIAALREQIEVSRSNVELKLKAESERGIREEQTLRAILDQSKVEEAQQNQAEIQYNLLKQDVDTHKALYTEFLQKLNQAGIQLAEQNNNLSLAEPAEAPGEPIGPNRLRAILTAMVLSLVGAIGLAFVIEYFDNTVKTVEDVTRYAQLPALGVIPAIAGATPRRLAGRARNNKRLKEAPRHVDSSEHLKMGAPELITLESRSSAAEAYRVLRTSVLLSSADSPPRTILVTSGQPGEGKTTTVVNTAISLAQLGASVLIVDCDLRKPSAHRVFGVDSMNGLSTYLSRNVELDGLIHKLQIPNLSILPSGAVPPNPAELISSDKMKNMLRKLSEEYTHILIDSPPVINVTDSVILSTMVDGVMLVVHGGKSSREIVQRTKLELATKGAKIFGVVLNNVDLRTGGYDYYYQYYPGYYSESGQSA